MSKMHKSRKNRKKSLDRGILLWYSVIPSVQGFLFLRPFLCGYITPENPRGRLSDILGGAENESKNHTRLHRM